LKKDTSFGIPPMNAVFHKFLLSDLLPEHNLVFCPVVSAILARAKMSELTLLRDEQSVSLLQRNPMPAIASSQNIIPQFEAQLKDRDVRLP
jgi:hypothetical protein